VLKSYEIKVIVSDGYQSVEDTFILSITPTLMLIMQLLFQFGSVFAVIIGAWNYKDEIHAILFKNTLKYHRKEQVLTDNHFTLEIPIIRLELEEKNEVCKFMRKKGIERLKRQRIFIMQKNFWISAYFEDNDFLG